VYETGSDRFSYDPMKIVSLRRLVRDIAERLGIRGSGAMICAGYDSKLARLLAAEVRAERLMYVEHGLSDTLMMLNGSWRRARPYGQKLGRYLWSTAVDAYIERRVATREQEFWTLLPVDREPLSRIPIRRLSPEGVRRTFDRIRERLTRLEPGLEELAHVSKETKLAIVLPQPLHEIGYAEDFWRLWIQALMTSRALSSDVRLVIKNHPRCSSAWGEHVGRCFSEHGIEVLDIFKSVNSSIPAEISLIPFLGACQYLLTPFSTSALYLGQLSDVAVVTGLASLVQHAPNDAVARHMREARALFSACLPPSRLRHV
jgi:hypothetical protein